MSIPLISACGLSSDTSTIVAISCRPLLRARHSNLFAELVVCHCLVYMVLLSILNMYMQSSLYQIVCMCREVAKAVRLRKACTVVVAPNIEHIEAEGGLDDLLTSILTQAEASNIPIVFALSCKKLGQVSRHALACETQHPALHHGAHVEGPSWRLSDTCVPCKP